MASQLNNKIRTYNYKIVAKQLDSAKAQVSELESQAYELNTKLSKDRESYDILAEQAKIYNIISVFSSNVVKAPTGDSDQWKNIKWKGKTASEAIEIESASVNSDGKVTIVFKDEQTILYQLNGTGDVLEAKVKELQAAANVTIPESPSKLGDLNVYSQALKDTNSTVVISDGQESGAKSYRKGDSLGDLQSATSKPTFALSASAAKKPIVCALVTTGDAAVKPKFIPYAEKPSSQ